MATDLECSSRISDILPSRILAGQQFLCLLIVGFLFSPAGSLLAQSKSTSQPATVVWDGAHLASMRALIASGNDAEFSADLKRLRRATKNAKRSGPYSVMDKKELPPSKDKHDYLSYSRYWWPDPDKEDGLPYIRKDGVVNRPLVNKGDRQAVGELFDHIVPLALSSYLADDKKAGRHAVKLLQTWFLNADTKMNPSLKFAQGIPGRSDGRCFGIIDTRGFIWLLDSVALLEASKAIEKEDLDRLREWFTEYVTWLETSPLANQEREAKNNHGSWYAAQASRIALFVGHDEFARSIFNQVKTERMPSQITEDGSQRFELERTKPVHYSLFNLSALTVVAQVADQLGEDLWTERLKLAVDRIAVLACGDKSERPKEIGSVKLSLMETIALKHLEKRLPSQNARKILDKVPVKWSDRDFSRLQVP